MEDLQKFPEQDLAFYHLLLKIILDFYEVQFDDGYKKIVHRSKLREETKVRKNINGIYVLPSHNTHFADMLYYTYYAQLVYKS